MTNELLRKNAEKLKIATVETAKESERGIVDIETLKAMAETEYLINHPEVRKTYDDVDKMMEDILG